MALAVCAGATSPAVARRGCAARVEAAARALGARPAGLATGDSASSVGLAAPAVLLSVPGAGGGVLLSIYLSPVGNVLWFCDNKLDVGSLIDGVANNSADMPAPSIA